MEKKLVIIFAPTGAMKTGTRKEIPGTRLYFRPGWEGSLDCDRKTLYIVIFVGAEDPVNRFALEAAVMLAYYDYGCEKGRILIGLGALMKYTSLWQELTNGNPNVDFTGGIETVLNFSHYQVALETRTCSYPDGLHQALLDYTKSRLKKNPELRNVPEYKIWDDYTYEGKHLHYFLISSIRICEGDKTTALELYPSGSAEHATFKYMDLL